jgi:hypothetical protein
MQECGPCCAAILPAPHKSGQHLLWRYSIVWQSN